MSFEYDLRKEALITPPKIVGKQPESRTKIILVS